jgi:hypothetical protein
MYIERYGRANGQCMSCQPGQYANVSIAGSDGSSLSTCGTCPMGYISNTTNAVACTMCRAGTYANPINGASSCIACAPPTYVAYSPVLCVVLQKSFPVFFLGVIVIAMMVPRVAVDVNQVINTM